MTSFRVILGYLAKKSEPLVSMNPANFKESPAALKKFHEEHSETYEPHVLGSLEWYGDDGFVEINKHLRGEGFRHRTEEKMKATERHIDNIDQAMEKGKLKHNTVLWRALREGHYHPLQKEMQKLGILNLYGDDYTSDETKAIALKEFRFKEASYVSTSLDRKYIESPSGILLKIYAPNGTPSVYLNGATSILEKDKDIFEFDGMNREQEVLLDRGLTFEVQNVFITKQKKYEEAGYNLRPTVVLKIV